MTPPSHAARQAAALRELAPGMRVGHADPELADWHGTIAANHARNWARPETGDVWVVTDGTGKGNWISASAVTIAGHCPDCDRPAHRVLPGNDFDSGTDRTPGWYHDETHDRLTCWAAKAAVEARAERRVYLGPRQLRDYLAAHAGEPITTAAVAAMLGWSEVQADGMLRVVAKDHSFGDLAEHDGSWVFSPREPPAGRS